VHSSGSIVIGGECGTTFSYSLSGQGLSGLLQASDATFEQTDSGSTSTSVVELKNTGTLPLIVTGGKISDTTDFSFDPVFLRSLPKQIAPGTSIFAQMLFHPNDGFSHSASVTWSTNIYMTKPLVTRMKTVSSLLGKGYSAGVAWSPDSLSIMIDTLQPSRTATGRIFLVNRGMTKKIVVHSMMISGADSAVFMFAGNEYGLPISSNDFLPANFVLNTQDSMWVDIRFIPDTTLSYPDLYRSRYSTLTALFSLESSNNNEIVFAPLVGSFSGSLGVRNSTSESETIKAVIVGSRLYINSVEKNSLLEKIELYDLLGRRVAEWGSGAVPDAGGYIMLPLPSLSSGMYLVRVGERSCKVMN
jgi:hypothetical protein